MTTDLNINDFRKPEHEITPIILERYSPRALSGEALTDDDFFALLEAAKWAPSAYNNQPWRFIYAKNNTPSWPKLFSLLGEYNQAWTDKAAALILIVSQQFFVHNDQPSPTASFDAGAAWENLALEAKSRGLIAHGMSGFDYVRAKNELNIPDGYRVEAMIAVGRPGNKEDLPENMQAGEVPSDRKKLAELISEGEFKF